jgi:Holliday junction resolvase RusA-like endonuclease
MIFIGGNTPSLKNSKRVVRMRNGATTLLPSQTVVNYVKKHGHEYMDNIDTWNEMLFKSPKDYPIKVGLRFVRDSRRRFDYINAAQIVLDLMVKHGYLPDDDAAHVVPVFLGYELNKDAPGVEITIL